MQQQRNDQITLACPCLYDSDNVYDNISLQYNNVCLQYEDVCLKYDNVCLSLSILHGRPVWRHAAGLDRYLAFACRFELHPSNERSYDLSASDTHHDNVCLHHDNVYLQYDNVRPKYAV